MDNIIGNTYHELTIQELIPKPTGGKYRTWNTPTWVRCKCSCGKVVDLPFRGVKDGIIKSCGHLRHDRGVKYGKYLASTRTEPPHVVYIDYMGKRQSISDWAKEYGIARTTLMYRLKRGYPMEYALMKELPKDDGYRLTVAKK